MQRNGTAEIQPESSSRRTTQGGWFKCSRGQTPLELIKLNPLAYVLAAVIAHRARWSDRFNPHGLTFGEALLGDYAACGMTESQYRTAKTQLKRWGLATFRTTNKGTIGKLMDTRLFSTFAGGDNGPDNGRHDGPDSRQMTDGIATNKELKNRRTKEQGEEPAPQFASPSEPEGELNGAALPRFAPLPVPLYLKTAEAMKAAAKSAIETLEADSDNRTSVLRPKATENIQWIEANPDKFPNPAERIKEIQDNPHNYSHPLKPEALAAINAWKGRIAEIDRALNAVE